jgi:hypothetical protein
MVEILTEINKYIKGFHFIFITYDKQDTQIYFKI